MKFEPPNRTVRSRDAWYAVANPLRADGVPTGKRCCHVSAAASYCQTTMFCEKSEPTMRWRDADAWWTSGYVAIWFGFGAVVIGAPVFVATSYSHVSVRKSVSLYPPNRTMTCSTGSYDIAE